MPNCFSRWLCPFHSLQHCLSIELLLSSPAPAGKRISLFETFVYFYCHFIFELKVFWIVLCQKYVLEIFSPGLSIHFSLYHLLTRVFVCFNFYKVQIVLAFSFIVNVFWIFSWKSLSTLWRLLKFYNFNFHI